jgi:hypothetical protein
MKHSRGRHQLRIAIKEFRYLCEFLGSLYKMNIKQMVKRIMDIQNLLGEEQDAVNTIKRLKSLKELARSRTIHRLIILQRKKIKGLRMKFNLPRLAGRITITAMSKLFIYLISALLVFPSLSSAQEGVNEFKKNNPDGQKYEFARSYISALRSFHSINERWKKNSPKKRSKGDDVKMIRWSLEYLALDNSDLRVAKNYMIRYLSSPNALMRKTADTLIVACDQGIELNNKQKDLWQDWLTKKAGKGLTKNDERSFVQAQLSIENKRKESNKSIINASNLMVKVLLSDVNSDDKGYKLAISQKQRDALLDKLDSYGKHILDWGIKPGHNTLDASITIIREVLEDPVYTVRK